MPTSDGSTLAHQGANYAEPSSQGYASQVTGGTGTTALGQPAGYASAERNAGVAQEFTGGSGSGSNTTYSQGATRNGPSGTSPVPFISPLRDSTHGTTSSGNVVSSVSLPLADQQAHRHGWPGDLPL